MEYFPELPEVRRYPIHILHAGAVYTRLKLFTLGISPIIDMSTILTKK
jgi:preprotein translocase subunit SecY